MHAYACKYMCAFTHSGAATITNGIATVAVNGLVCEITYNVIAGGTLNGVLVGPRSSHGTITAGYCPQVMTTTIATTTTTTTTMNGKEEILYVT